MKPGKLFRFCNTATVYPVACNRDEVGKKVLSNTLFMVINLKPSSEDFRAINYYDLHNPWLILLGEKLYFVDTLGRKLLDVTPFVNENGEAYWHEYFLTENSKETFCTQSF